MDLGFCRRPSPSFFPLLKPQFRPFLQGRTVWGPRSLILVTADKFELSFSRFAQFERNLKMASFRAVLGQLLISRLTRKTQKIQS
jgi:hypothetical protein